jgi:hypothetical protein
MANITITIPDDKIQRVRNALTININNLDENGNLIEATNADLQNFFKIKLKDMIRSVELQQVLETERNAFEDIF